MASPAELPPSMLAGHIARSLAGVSPRRRLLVGVSGGVDSLLLLVLLRDLISAQAPEKLPLPPPLPLLALHVNHGLHPQADVWAQHVKDFCAGAGIPCIVKVVAVDRQCASREAAARTARYAAFAEELQPGDALLLAHHADDQAETFLLRLLRGSGLTGLAAMRPARQMSTPDDCWLLRPLLPIPRSMIEAEAVRRGLRWVEDPANADQAFTRNFLRHDVLPLLRSRWPAADKTLNATAQRLAEAGDLLDEYLDADLQALLQPVSGIQADGVALDVAGLCAGSPARQRALLRRWLVVIGAPPFHDTWIEQLRALAASRGDSEAELRVAGWEVHRFRGHLHAFVQLPAIDASRVLNWDLHGDLDLGPGCGRLSAVPAAGGRGLLLAGVQAGDPVQVRFRTGGETIRLNAGSGSRALKKVMQERDVPPWLRSRAPLLYAGGRLVAVADWFADGSVANAREPVVEHGSVMAWEGTPAGVRLRWLPPWPTR